MDKARFDLGEELGDVGQKCKVVRSKIGTAPCRGNRLCDVCQDALAPLFAKATASSVVCHDAEFAWPPMKEVPKDRQSERLISDL